MCVIAVSNVQRPTAREVEQMWHANRYGGGVAWREKRADGVPIVRWKKGIESPEEMVEFARSLPQPYVLHFRVPSVGGPHPLLTHPFPIDPETWLALEGETAGSVLFHNGTLTRWKERMWDCGIAMLESGLDLKVPGGKWSDSRAMAWIAGVMGVGALQALDEKVIAFGPTDDAYDAYGEWDAVGDGLWVSNLYWRGQSSGGVNKRYEPEVKNAHRPTQGAQAAAPKELPPAKLHGTTCDGTGTSTSLTEGVPEVAPDQHPFRSGPSSLLGVPLGRSTEAVEAATENCEEADGQDSAIAEGQDCPGETRVGSGQEGTEGALTAVTMYRYPNGHLVQAGDDFLWARNINQKKFSSSRLGDPRVEVVTTGVIRQAAIGTLMSAHQRHLRDLSPEELDELRKG